MRTTRDGYDEVAEQYAAMFEHDLAANPFDRAMLGVFSETVPTGGTVADIGCGPGRITAHLAWSGLHTFGIDLSPEMIRVARSAHPDLHFEVGSMSELALADGALAAIVAWYGIIHLTPQRLPDVIAEFARVLVEGGQLLLAFQAADEPDDVVPYAHRVAPSFLWSPRRIEQRLEDGGFRVVARMTRRPAADADWEHHGQAYLLAEKTSASCPTGRRPA